MALVVVFLAIRFCLFFLTTESNTSAWVPFITVTFSILMFLFLWIFSYRLSGWLLPKHAQEKSEQLTNSAIESIAISLLAIYFICQGAVDLFYWLSFYFFSNAQGVEINQYDINFTASFATSAFKFVLGLLLLVGIKPILRGLSWLRTAGLTSNG